MANNTHLLCHIGEAERLTKDGLQCDQLLAAGVAGGRVHGVSTPLLDTADSDLLLGELTASQSAAYQSLQNALAGMEAALKTEKEFELEMGAVQ